MKTHLIPRSKAKTAYGLLSETRKLILAEPKRYDQYHWKRTYGPNLPTCGTVCCVGGWTETLKGRRLSGAAAILGLSEDQADDLFARMAATGDAQTLRHARSGASHIRRFQKKYAKQLKATRV